MRLSQAKQLRAQERAALALDHLLYGLVLSEMRARPREQAGEGSGRAEHQDVVGTRGPLLAALVGQAADQRERIAEGLLGLPA